MFFSSFIEKHEMEDHRNSFKPTQIYLLFLFIFFKQFSFVPLHGLYHTQFLFTFAQFLFSNSSPNSLIQKEPQFNQAATEISKSTTDRIPIIYNGSVQFPASSLVVAEIAFLSKTSPNVSAYAISVTLGGTISAPLPEMDLLSDVIGRQQYRGRAYLSLLYLQSTCSRESAGLFAHTRTRLSLVCIENDTRYRNTEGGNHR